MTAAITMAASANASVSERLVAFARDWRARGVPPAVRHEAKRLLLNQLKASVAATTHPAIGILHDWARHSAAGASGAQVLWLATNTGAAQAAMVNAALFEVLDFHDTYIPCFMHAVSAVLPAVLAEAEVSANSGAEFVSALALGLEIELAVAHGVFAPHSKLRAAVTPAHRGVGGTRQSYRLGHGHRPNRRN